MKWEVCKNLIIKKSQYLNQRLIKFNLLLRVKLKDQMIKLDKIPEKRKIWINNGLEKLNKMIWLI